MHISMDLDGTLIDWINKPEKVAAQRLGVKEPKRLDYFYKGFPIKLRTEIMSLFKDLEFMSMNNLTYDVLDKLAISMWKEKGHTLTVITSRDKSQEMRIETERIIKEWFPEIDNLIIVKHGMYKIDYFECMKLDVWIDDHPDIAHMAMEMGIRTFLIDKSYNNGPFWGNLHRVKSIYRLWKDGIIK